jgi:hypothetical protein
MLAAAMPCVLLGQAPVLDALRLAAQGNVAISPIAHSPSQTRRPASTRSDWSFSLGSDASLGGRMHADPRQHQIRRDAQTVVQQHRFDFAVANDFPDFVIGDEFHPCCSCSARIFTHGCAELRGKRNGVAGADRYVEPELAQGRGAFQGDKAVADDQRPLFGFGGAHDLFSLGFRTQDEHLRQISAGQLQRIGLAAGGEYRGVVTMGLAILQMQGFRCCVEGGDFALPAFDALFL